MNARSLFFKIFLWFWLANTLVIAVTALVIWIYPFAETRRHGRFDQLHELQVRGALAVRHLQGQDAFERHSEELDTATGFRTYWLDAEGRELRGQSLPQSVSKAIKEYGEKALRERKRIDLGPPNPIAIPLADVTGRAYLTMAEPAGPGPEPYFQQLLSSQAFFSWVFAAIVTAGIGCYTLARYLTSPVRSLQMAAEQLGAGVLSARVTEQLTARGDEIGELGREFNRMAEQIGALIASQKQLLRDVSHELRSPLARLYLALEMAARDAGSGIAPEFERVWREAEKINELIGQLLTLSRLEASLPESRSRIELGALVREVVADADFEALAQGRRVRMLACEPCEVEAMPQLLRSAVENVVRNAVRYTAAGSEVEVRVRRERDGAASTTVVEIRDHGPGVPQDALQHIFQPFYRVSSARERDSGGAGLGLAIADRAVRAHRGAITASNAPGGGLLVRIAVPLIG